MINSCQLFNDKTVILDIDNILFFRKAKVSLLSGKASTRQRLSLLKVILRAFQLYANCIHRHPQV